MFKIGLVLSGALSKGAYQLGFIHALLEKVDLDDIKMVSGTSIGACNAYAFATGKLDVIEELWTKTDISNMFKMWKKIVFNGLIKKHLKKLMHEGDKINMPIYVSSFQIFPWWKFRYIKFEGEYEPYWKKIMNGAIGFPILTGAPKIYKGRLYSDGGIIDNIPLNPLLDEDLDIIIVLHFDSKFQIDIDDYKNVIVLDIDLSTSTGFGKYSFNFSNEHVMNMKQAGYDYGGEIIDRLFRHTNIEDLREEAKKIRLEEYEYRKSKKSLDTWPTRLNRIFKKTRNKPNNKAHIKDYK